MDTRLLVVVPDAARREWLVNAIAHDADITVVGAGPDANEAYLSSSEAHSANALILDLSAPEAANSSFWLTIHVIYPAAKLVVLAQEPLNEAALAFALQAGVHSFAQWKDSAETIREAVLAACEGRRSYSAPWLIVAAQRLIRDIETGLIQVGIQRTKQDELALLPQLTALEKKALSYLLRNEGKIISPAELVREVWKQAPTTGDIANQVNCCIKRLRRKLSADPHNRLKIVTVRKQGYRLETT